MNEPAKKISKFGFREFISLVFRLLLGLLFVYASIDKIRYPYSFQTGLHEYQLLPPIIEPALSILIPWAEFIAGVCLLLGLFYRSSGLILLVLLIAFEYGMVVNILRGKDMECHCFNLDFLGISDKLSWGTAVRDLILILMAYETAFLSHPRISLDQWLDNRRIRSKKTPSEI